MSDDLSNVVAVFADFTVCFYLRVWFKDITVLKVAKHIYWRNVERFYFMLKIFDVLH